MGVRPSFFLVVLVDSLGAPYSLHLNYMAYVPGGQGAARSLLGAPQNGRDYENPARPIILSHPAACLDHNKQYEAARERPDVNCNYGFYAHNQPSPKTLAL